MGKILEVKTFTHSPHSRLSIDCGLQLTEFLKDHPEYKISNINSYVIEDIAYVTIVFTD